MAHKNQKKNSLAVLQPEKQKKVNGIAETIKTGSHGLLRLWGKTILGTALLSVTLFFLSSLLLFPEPEIKVKKVFESSKMASYEILISNRSVMDIHHLTIAFRFDEEYPVESYYLDEPQFKTDFVLKNGFISRLSISVGETRTKKPFVNPIIYSSGFHAITNKLNPNVSATIYVNIDKTYNGPREQVFPVSLKRSLRSNSYYVTYQHMPLGVFAPVAITKEGCYDFRGRKTQADNYGKKYNQQITGPDGKDQSFGLTVTKEDAEK